jgi:hypothetical protein
MEYLKNNFLLKFVNITNKNLEIVSILNKINWNNFIISYVYRLYIYILVQNHSPPDLFVVNTIYITILYY